MAEDKQFDPTPSKIRKARREGNVPKSQELTTVVVFAASGAATLAVAPWIGLVTNAWFAAAPFARTGTTASLRFVITIAVLTAVPLAAASIAAAAINLMQTGGPVMVAPKFKPDLLNPGAGFKRMFSGESAIAAARGTLTFVVVGAAFGPVVSAVFTRVAAANTLAVFAALALEGIARIGGTAIAIAAAFAVVDVIISRNRWRKKLRMDAFELKRDLKETEGNPQLKSRRRSIHRALQRGAARNVKKAAFVVTNPTHLAIAIAYDPPEIAVPRVLVIAADGVALRVRELARSYGIAIIEDVALARLLFNTATVGASIPRETFVAVAELVVMLRRAACSA